MIKRGAGGGHVQVTFEVDAAVHAERANLCGEFNDWSTSSHPLVRVSDGDLVCEVVLAPGKYRFRYYLGNGRWENDWNADAYVENEYGGADSVVIVDGTYRLD